MVMNKLERRDTDSTLSDSQLSLSSLDSSSSNDDSHATPKRSVMFSTVSVREYDRVVGDHPDCRFGPPLSIDWAYAQHEPAALDDYEKLRSETKKSFGPYRLSALARKNILNKEFGIPAKQIAASEKEVQKILKQRKQTASQSKKSEKVETLVQSAKRKMKRTFSRENVLEGMSKCAMFVVPVQ